MRLRNTLAGLALGAGALSLCQTARAAEDPLLTVLSGYGITSANLVSDQTFAPGIYEITKIAGDGLNNPLYADFYDFGTYMPGTTVFSGNVPDGTTSGPINMAAPFGLYLNNTSGHTTATGGVYGLFSSEDALNFLIPGPHVAAVQAAVDAVAGTSVGPLTNEKHFLVFSNTPGVYYIGIEDRTLINATNTTTPISVNIDFNDYVVRLQAVPEVDGNVAMLVGTLMAGSAALLRRRRARRS